ncbi:hypothetical protein PSENEW3_00006074 [Picochlorum sp. SENEW3]|nr:hypothetical protein PSENEW3_00006074 [Picochlorum sp. SENEW3]
MTDIGKQADTNATNQNNGAKREGASSGVASLADRSNCMHIETSGGPVHFYGDVYIGSAGKTIIYKKAKKRTRRRRKKQKARRAACTSVAEEEAQQEEWEAEQEEWEARQERRRRENESRSYQWDIDEGKYCVTSEEI